MPRVGSKVQWIQDAAQSLPHCSILPRQTCFWFLWEKDEILSHRFWSGATQPALVVCRTEALPLSAELPAPVKWGGGGKNVELVLAALCTRSSALARGELAHESTGGGFPSCVFVFSESSWKTSEAQKNQLKQGCSKEESVQSVNTAPKTLQRVKKMMWSSQTARHWKCKELGNCKWGEVGNRPPPLPAPARQSPGFQCAFSRWLDSNFQLDLGLQPCLTCV